MIFGVFTFGVLADYVGRKTVIIPLLICVAGSGIGTSLAPNFEVFMTARVINAFFLIGIWETQFTYSIELGMGLEFFWVGGWLILALLGYLIRSWRTLMLVVSLPSTLAFLLYWFIPENPRWLIATHKLEKSEQIIRNVGKSNKKELPADWKLHPVQTSDADDKKTNIFDIFRTPNMRSKTFIIWYNFFVNAFVYFGLTLNSGDLGGDVFINFSLSGLLEIPAYILAIFVLLRYGRRFPYCISMILSGLSLLCISLVPQGNWCVMMLALFGKTCITFAFATLFIYSTEIFPTVIRTGAIGSASFIGRLGGILAPWVGGLSSVHPYLPVWIFGINAVFAGLWAFSLPETAGKPLAYTIQESEMLKVNSIPWKKIKKCSP
ncbi:organic cation transporter protein isoform X2 [Eurytemora carolleeae]|uniref:organic cation transporter protein isoform X2 n=1 Tax=Eurytemora carolleeae TaxID=1294199 RepID=UPI000C76A091|nr:organic cation transporter protein isoform X2 [Eurytemora carolleeae]|eukprot:XP_023323116.1 organic cation transporter protein-like isoform X2 [Eurytemora affinis]